MGRQALFPVKDFRTDSALCLARLALPKQKAHWLTQLFPWQESGLLLCLLSWFTFRTLAPEMWFVKNKQTQTEVYPDGWVPFRGALLEEYGEVPEVSLSLILSNSGLWEPPPHISLSSLVVSVGEAGEGTQMDSSWIRHPFAALETHGDLHSALFSPAPGGPVTPLKCAAEAIL